MVNLTDWYSGFNNDPQFTQVEVEHLVDRYRRAFPVIYSQYSTVQEDTMNDTQLTLDSIVLAGITYRGPITVELSRYIDSNQLAIVLITREDGYPEVLSKVTVVVPGETPADGCVFVKDYSESDGMVKALEEKGWGKRTGREVKSGWVSIPEVELTGELAALVKAGGAR